MAQQLSFPLIKYLFWTVFIVLLACKNSLQLGLINLFGFETQWMDKPDDPSPFGVNEGNIQRDKSLECTCGLANLTLADVNATSTISPAQVPWLVFIYVMFDSRGKLTNPAKICSGTIINDRVVLTSASCLVGLPATQEERKKFILHQSEEVNPENILVLRANGPKINLKNNKTFTRLEVEHITFNPYFLYHQILYDKHDWDIALIELQQPLAFNDTSGFVPICLPQKYLTDAELVGVSMNSFGWKKYSVGDRAKLQKSANYSLKLYKASYVHPKRICQVVTVRDWLSDRYFCNDGVGFLDSKFIVSLQLHSSADVNKCGSFEPRGSPMVVQSSVEPYPFIQYGIVSWDLVGILVRKKNVRSSINLSGFLEKVEEFSKIIGAKWCFNGAPQAPPLTPASDWDGGMDLIKRMSLSMVLPSELKRVSASHRQYYPSSVCKCGLSPMRDPGEGRRYNWNVQLVNVDRAKESRCSGSIVNDKIILTTASCIKNMFGGLSERGLYGSEMEIIHRPENLKVQLNFMIPVANTSTLKVEMVIPHMGYKKSEHDSSNNDIALIVTEENFNFAELKDEVSPICLPEYASKLTSMQKPFLLTSFNDSSHKVKLTLLEKSLCKIAWEEIAEEITNPLGIIIPRDVEEMFDFSTKFCGILEGRDFETYVKEGDGIPVVLPFFLGTRKTALFQIGIVSQMTNSILTPINGSLLANHEDFQGFHLKNKIISAFNEIRPLLQYIDYFSLVVDAKWCLSSSGR